MQRIRSYTVNYTQGEAFSKRYPALARFPFILDSRPGYHRLGNGYLVDRGLGLWDAASRGRADSGGRIPSEQTMRNYAQWLANFLEWADLRGVDILTCSYVTHVAGWYQKEMLEGLWSRTGKGLSANTVNLRVQQACDFLTWMSDKGKRGAFLVPVTERVVSIGSTRRQLQALHGATTGRSFFATRKRKCWRKPSGFALNTSKS